MNWYNFTLLFEIPGPITADQETWADEYIKALGENGFTDVTVGSGIVGVLSMDFCYLGASKVDAIQKALKDVIGSIPKAKLLACELPH